jgi:cell division protein FtsB
MPSRSYRRRSKRQKEYLQALSFFLVTVGSIAALIAYLWVYTEVDETLLALEIQHSTVEELTDEIQSLQSSIEYLQRADVISAKARTELNMRVARPESLVVYLDTPVSWGDGD